MTQTITEISPQIESLKMQLRQRQLEAIKAIETIETRMGNDRVAPAEMEYMREGYAAYKEAKWACEEAINYLDQYGEEAIELVETYLQY